jgi:hypothetical protein
VTARATAILGGLAWASLVAYLLLYRGQYP